MLLKVIPVIIFALKASGVIFVAINVFMKGKPVIAICLAVVDYIKLDKKAFRGYGFWCFCGLGGSGKTLSMVDYLLAMKRRYPKLKIYTNFTFDLADGYIKNWQELVQLQNFELIEIKEKKYNKLRTEYKRLIDGKFYEIVNNGILFGFDEIQMWLASQNWKKAPEDLLYSVSQSRKFHKMVIASSQVYTRINVILREQTNFIIECKSMFLGRLIFTKSYHTATYIPPTERAGQKKRMKAVKRYSYVAYDGIRNKYDTGQVMQSLVDEATTESMLLQALQESLKNIIG